MELYKITIPKDDAWRVIEALGHKDFAHFIDLNKQEQLFNLPFAFQIKACDETERRLQYLIAQSKQTGLTVTRPQTIEIQEREIRKLANDRRRAVHLLFQDLEQDTLDKEKFVVSQLKTIQDMQAAINKQVDYYNVLHFVATQANTLGSMAPGLSRSVDDENMAAPLIQEGGGVSISFVSGTIRNEERERMSRILYRVTRGKALTRFGEPFVQDGHQRLVYMVVYQEGQMIRDRVQKICDSFMGSRFEIPSLGEELFAEHGRVRTQIQEDRALLRVSRAQLKEYLKSINGVSEQDAPNKPSLLEIVQFHVAKEKAIYTAINMMKLHGQAYHGFIWAPVSLEPVIRRELEEFETTEFQSWRSNYDEPHFIQPPTYFKLNDIILPLQGITNTYGVPSYGEANPATFAIVTFPFLFAVMFGDYGHGSLILFFGLCMVLFKERLEKLNPGLKQALQLRYLILMMGIFSCYNGLLYNEWFAIPYPWFKSCYVTTPLPTSSVNYVFSYVDFPLDQYPLTTTPAYDGTHCVYPFGMDPTWFLSESNLLTVQNSVKMKMSVIIGVAHMTMGICVKGMNNWNNRIVFYFEVVAGLIILLGLFGWMDVLIFIKWFYKMNPYSSDPTMMAKINAAPSIITIMINNFLLMGKQPFTNATVTNAEIYLFPAQRGFSEFFVACALFVMPFMLFVKPCSIACCPKFAGFEEFIHHEGEGEAEVAQAEETEVQMIDSDDSNQVAANSIKEYQRLLTIDLDIHAVHSVNEAFIHQLIETIEFVLGSVSNTASYLRLWALSLAHSQLALVFLQEILQVPWNHLPQNSIAAQTVGSFLIWFPFMAVTWSVLLMMDVLECFLHTLRLHWVEFQNKFYKGAGYLYVPFSFESVFEKELSR